MKIYFEDPEYDGQFLRTVAYGPRGAQIGEAWAIASRIKAGDPATWYNEWSSYADRFSILRSNRKQPGTGLAPATCSCARQTTIAPRTFLCLRCLLIRA